MIIIKRQKLNLSILFFFGLIFTLISTGCSTVNRPEQEVNDSLKSLNHKITLGQTFLSRYEGLNGFGVYLKPENEGDGSVILSLISDPTENGEIIDRSVIPLADIKSPGYHPFYFNPQDKSTNHYYFISLEIEGGGNIQVGTGGGNTYLNGAFYQNGSPEDAQMVFNLHYNSRLLIFGLVKEGIYWLLLLSICLWLYILPGWALLSLVIPGWRTTHWSVKIGLSVGVSIAIYPILFLWTDLIGLHLGAMYAWFPPFIGLLVLLWNNRNTIKNSENRNRFVTDLKNAAIHNLKTPLFLLPKLVLLLIILLIVATRFWPIRNLDAPMWGDSYQHTMIAQLLVDNRGLFDSWSPYVDLITFTYHFGFHSVVAVFHWITGLSIPQATLWSGQIINLLAVISLCPLAYQLGKNHWSGSSAIFLGGLVLSLPMFYINWGRYTQLTGQVILGSWTYLAWIYFDSKSFNKRFGLLVGLVLGGLALTHYRVLLFALIFIPIYYLLYSHKILSRDLITRIILISVVSVFFILPWIFQLITGNLPNILVAQVSPKLPQPTNLVRQYNEIGNLLSYLPIIIWLVTPIIIGWGLWKRDKQIALISLWWFLILIAANPQWLRLPGAGVITNFAVFIGAYFPISLILGSFAGWMITKWNLTNNKLTLRPIINIFSSNQYTSIILLLLIAVFSIWAARQRIKDVSPYDYALFSRPDMNASNWIKENLENDARFLVNSFFAYGGTAVVGSDGGWWLPLFANRATTLPPLTYVSEESSQPNYRESVNELIAEIEKKGIEHPDIFQMLADRNVTHVYIGQRQGQVNSPKPLLSIDQLLSSFFYQPVYYQDRVWVFEIDFPEGINNIK